MAATDEFLEFLPLYSDQDEATIRARWDAWANEGVSADQVDQWIDVREGSIFHVCTQVGVREAARIYDLMGSEVPAAASPLWAWEQYLDDHAAVQTIDRKVATPAEGYATFTAPPGTVLAGGFTVGVPPVTDDDEPPEFQVTAGGTVPAQAAAPTGLAAVPSAAGGTLPATTTYRYVVTAVDAAGETTPTTEVVAVTGGGATNSVALDWDDVATATSYRVYRRTGGVAGPPWSFVADVTVSSFTDTGAVVPDAARVPPVVNTTGGKLRLPVQALVAGSLGNVSAGAVTAVITPADNVAVTNAASIGGGTDTESDPQLRGRLLDRYRGQGSGNRADYVRWALEEPGVTQVTVIALWNGAGTVKVVALGPGGTPVSASVVASLQTRLDPVPGKGEGEAPIGAIVTVTTATAVPIAVAATVEFEAGYTLDGFGGTIALRALIEAAVRNYVEAVAPGGEVVRAQVVGRISNVVGVHDVDIASVLLNGAAANIVIDDDPAQTPDVTAVTLTAGTF